MKNEITLDDGNAQPMGDGVYVVCQHDEHGVAHSIVLTQADLRRLQEPEG